MGVRDCREPRSGDADIDQWLRDEMQVAQVLNGDHCIDNERFAEVGNDEQETDYTAAEQSGCCGRDDSIVTHTSGRNFRIGFNYGH